MTSIVVAGALANKPRNGGEAWVRLSWIRGFKKLGCRVFFVEEIQRRTCVDAFGNPSPFEDCVNRACFQNVTEQFGLADSAALIYEGGEQVFGLSWKELLAVAEAADLLINISGHLVCPALLSRFRRKAYIDIDPGFTQFWHADPNTPFKLEGHEFYYTIGENIGAADCPIPTGGIHWRPTRQSIVLEDWPVVPADEPRRFTTIASWRGPFGPVEHDGKKYGLKVHEFRKFLPLPGAVAKPALGGTIFEIALDIHSSDAKDAAALRDHGWRVVDPKMVAGDPAAFRRYIQGSGAEFSVAQGIYVETNSGWFSDRSVRYLASGKPVLVQDTGCARNFSNKEGLLTFRTLEEAAAGAARIGCAYDAHCRAARLVAETYFDSDKVLGRLLDEVGVAP